MSFHKKIEFSLSRSSIEKAIQEVKALQEKLKDGVRQLAEKLLEEGVDMAKLEVSALDAIDTGGLMASIGCGAFNTSTGTGVIYAGAYYAIFVEYGTGIVGAGSPHPVPDTAGVGSEGNLLAMTYTGYDTNGHGEDGWYYMSDVDGSWHWTKGMPARPFMYNTYRYLENLAERIGADVIGRSVGN